MALALLTRRQALASAFASASVSVAATARAQPAPSTITDELIAAAKKEGKVSHYTSDDLTVATNIGKMFEAKYPGITFQLERSGAERNYQRISQEYASAIHAVDVISTSDLSHLTTWKKSNLILRYQVAEAAAWAANARDPDGFYTKQFFTLMVPGYNTRLVKPEDAPKSWTDLLDPKWKGKIVSWSPGDQGTADLAPEERLPRLTVDYQFWRIEHDGICAGALHAGVQAGGGSVGLWGPISFIGCAGSWRLGAID